MKTQFAIVCCLMSFVLEAAAPKAEQPWQTAAKTKDQMWRQGKTCEEIIDALERMRSETHSVTSAYSRAYIDRLIVSLCRRPVWTGLKRWDIKLEQRIPDVVRRDLDDAEVGFTQKVELAGFLAEYLAGEKQFDEAEKLLKGLLANSEKQKKSDVAALWLALSDVFRWQDRFDEAWQALEKASDCDAFAAAERGLRLAEAKGEESRAESLLKRIPQEYTRLLALARSGRCAEKELKRALDFVTGTDNPPRQRAEVAISWFANRREAQAKAAFAALSDIDLSKNDVADALMRWNGAIPAFVKVADWDGVIGLYDVFKACKSMQKPAAQMAYLTALAAKGRRDEALAVAKEQVAKPGVKGREKTEFEICAAILSGSDVKAAIVSGESDRKAQIALTTFAVTKAMAWDFGDLAEKLAADYSSYYVDHPQRTLRIPYSRETIATIADWRRIYDKLDHQVCDRKFGLNFDDLVTDVATGRKAVEKTDRDSASAEVEVSGVCDRKGLHLFLRVEDPNARAVEDGFAGGIGTEMYFAPGLYRPYICMNSDPREGVRDAFHTTYDSFANSRIDVEGVNGPDAFRSETAFSDSDYVLHMTFAWDTFYRELPVDGSKWRFECIAFGPKGGFTLGGSVGVHNSSKWCDLAFELKPEDVAAIRRGVLYRAVKGWRMNGRMDRFDTWADEAIGDPEFYREVLKPLEAELVGYAKEVKPEMSDDDVNRIYEKALPRLKGLSHEIDRLRREWLMEQACR